jgi:ornithine carbamoyltransferase
MSVTDTRTAPRKLLRISDLGAAQVKHLLELAVAMKATPLGFRKSHAGRTLACCPAAPAGGLFPLQAAAWRLGMLPVSVPPGALGGSGESSAEMAAVLSGYADAIAVQGFPEEELEQLAESARVPVVNAGTAGHHPCQALADLLTLRERFGELSGLHQTYLGNGMNVAEPTSLHVAYVGDGDPAAHSLMEAGALAGMHLVVATPPGREPDPRIRAATAELADAHGGGVRVVNDPREAVRGADAVYAGAWAEPQRPETLGPYEVDSELMAMAKPGAVFMHPHPAQRGREVSEELLGSRQSAVLEQAWNLLPTAQAVLHALLQGDWPA